MSITDLAVLAIAIIIMGAIAYVIYWWVEGMNLPPMFKRTVLAVLAIVAVAGIGGLAIYVLGGGRILP